MNAVSGEALANHTATIQNFPVTGNTGGVGDIVGFRAPVGLAHSSINLGGGTLVYAGEKEVRLGTVLENQSGHTAVVYRTYRP